MKYEHGDGAHVGVVSIGAALRQAREARGESLGDVAHALKLNPRQVEAIEQERFDLLPGKAFVRGFVRNYARHVGLDAEQLVAQLPDAYPAAGVQPMELSPPHNARGTLPSSGEPARQSPRGVLVLLLGAAAVLGVAWYFDWFNVAHITQPTTERSSVQPVREPLAASASGETRPDPVTTVTPVQVVAPPQVASPAPEPAVVPPTPVALATPAAAATPVSGASEPSAGVSSAVVVPPPAVVTPEPLPAAEATPVPALGATPATAGVASVIPDGEVAPEPSSAEPGQLVFHLRGESWIQVRDASGTTLYMGTGAAGTTRTVQGTPPFAVVVGNAAQVTLEHGGKPFDLTPHTRNGGVARATVE